MRFSFLDRPIFPNWHPSGGMTYREMRAAYDAKTTWRDVLHGSFYLAIALAVYAIIGLCTK